MGLIGMSDHIGTTGTGVAQVSLFAKTRMVIGLARVAQVEQLLLKKNNKNLKEPSRKWMKQHAEKTCSRLVLYLCHPCQASVYAAFSVYVGGL